MKKEILNLKSTLPTVDDTYSNVDVLGNTFGRYFDYKKETALINHETQKVEQQAKVMNKQIEANLKLSLDENNKKLKKEMKHLKVIAKFLDKSSKNQKKILDHIVELTSILRDPEVQKDIKEYIPNLIAMAHQQLNDERASSMQNINAMGDFDLNRKLIGDE